VLEVANDLAVNRLDGTALEDQAIRTTIPLETMMQKL
jgi:hypothetical protein